MQKHTPGPWYAPHICDEKAACNCTYVLSDKYAGSICDISVDNGKAISQGGNDAPPLEEAIANAMLITAAPDLLELVLTANGKNGCHTVMWQQKAKEILNKISGE